MLTDNNMMVMFFKSQTMLVLMACSIVVVTFALERWIYFLRTRYSATEFKAAMRKYLSRNQLGDFARYCEKGSGSLGRIMGVAVENLGAGREQVDQILDTAIEKEQLKLEKHLVVLGTLANIAPLLGLFGTVVGIIRAFRDIAMTGSGGSSVIAMGVSEALLTTAAGIVIAVIATVFYNIFTRSIRVRATDAEDARNDFWKYVSSRPVE
jgi:biopolymer transport protein ExbB